MKRFNKKSINKGMRKMPEYSITIHSLLDDKDYEVTGSSVKEASEKAINLQNALLKELLGA